MATSTPVEGVLLAYHRPTARWYRNASTVLEHVRAFGRHSSHPVWEVNVDEGFPKGLEDVEFRTIALHYSVFGMGGYHLDAEWLSYLDRSPAQKIAFFQDECTRCQRRFAFLNDHGIDCVYTCLEPSEFDKVYGHYTGVPRLETNVPGYVSEELIEASRSFGRPDAQRTIDVGYRGRPLPAYLGRGALEKHAIGVEFGRRAASHGLRLDLAGGENDRIYGADWYRFMGNCRAFLGVESGVSAFDLEDEVMNEYERLQAQGRSEIGPDDLETLDRWEDVVYYRTVSPRHFEAAAFGVCQVLFPGRYSGALEPDVHYIPLEKDFSNFDDVLAKLTDADVRAQITANARRDLIDSGDWSYKRLVAGFDRVLEDGGMQPAPPDPRADAAIERGRRLRYLRTQDRWIRHLLRARPEWQRAKRIGEGVGSSLRKRFAKGTG